MRKTKKLLLIIDGHNYINRAFFAAPDLTNKAGVHTNVLKGFSSILIKDIKTLQPSHVLVTLDKGGKPGWRKDLYPEYKQNRAEKSATKADREKAARRKIMMSQIDDLILLIKALGIRILQKSGVEADDLMGTIAKEYALKGFEVLISTSDKDMAQLVTDKIKIQRPDRKILGEQEILAIHKVKPTKIVDLLAITGDKVDGIPGIARCGKATAAKLIKQHKSVEGLVKAFKEKKLKAPLRKCIIALGGSKALLLNKQLVSLSTETHKVRTADLVFPNKNFDAVKIKDLCKRLEMKETEKQLNGLMNTSVSAGLDYGQ